MAFRKRSLAGALLLSNPPFPKIVVQNACASHTYVANNSPWSLASWPGKMCLIYSSPSSPYLGEVQSSWSINNWLIWSSVVLSWNWQVVHLSRWQQAMIIRLYTMIYWCFIWIRYLTQNLNGDIFCICHMRNLWCKCFQITNTTSETNSNRPKAKVTKYQFVATPRCSATLMNT